MKENSIEEDIKIVENFIIYFNENIQIGNMADLTVLGEETKAIEHILSDYKRVLKENEEWQRAYQEEKDKQFDLIKENEKLKALDLSNSKIIANMSTRHFQDREKIRESIPVQKIKDKIEELKKKVEELTDEKGYWGGSDLLEQIKVLQQLLEKEK